MIAPTATFDAEADSTSLTFSSTAGPTVILPAERLRLACKCAHCIRARVDGRFPDSFPGIRIAAVHDMGYGVNILFSDGHDRGIYPHVYLATLAGG